MNHKSIDEVKTEYISAMGEDLGAIFFSLYRRVVELHIVWQQYRQLFGSDPETIQLLNRTAGLFFKIVQDELWDSVLLGISRLTDPPESGRFKNLTVLSLPPLIKDPTLRSETLELCLKAQSSAEPAREHRNKRIAHQDHGYFRDRTSNPLSGISRALVEDMLSALRDTLNRVDSYYRDSTVMYERFSDSSGARVLVQKLWELEHPKSE